MLLDELLIKIGIDADSQAMREFEQFLNSVNDGTENAVDGLSSFAKSIEDIVSNATAQARDMPEFAEFFQSIEQLQQETANLSQDESLDAWVQKLIESDQMLSAFGEDFINNSAELTRELQEAGLSAEQVESVINKLGAAIEQKKNSVDLDSKAVLANTEATKENADAVNDLSGDLIELWANKYGADELVQKFNILGVSINAATLKVAAFGAAFLAATVGVKNFVDANLDALDEIKQLSNVTGESADQIYLLGKVAEVNGSSAQAAQSSIEGLSRTIGEAAAGVGRGAKSFEQYGLSAKKANGEIKSSSELFGEISEKMQQMSNQEQIAMLSKLGIDGSMIQMLRLGNDELAEQIALAEALTLGVGNAENAETAAAFKDALTQVSQVFTAIGEYVSLRVAPSIQRLAESFTKWFVENNDFIKSILNGFSKVLSFLFEVAGAINNVIESTIGWKSVIIALGGLMLWLSRRMLLAFATNPITLAVGAVTALFLLIDDFMTYLEGGETALGDFWKPFADGWKAIKPWVDKAKEWVKSFANGWDDALDVIKPLKGVLSIVWSAIESIYGSFSRLLKQIFGATSAVDEFGNNGESVGSALASVFNFIAQTLEGLSGVIAVVATALSSSFEAAISAVIGLFKMLGAVWDGIVYGWTSGDWLGAFKRMFSKMGDVVLGVWDNIKKAAIEFVNSLISIVNKFGAGIEPIEIPITQRVQTIGENVGSVASSAAGFAQSAASMQNMVLGASMAASSGASQQTTNTDNSQKNSNNKITITQHIQGSDNPKAVADQSARAINNQLSTVIG
jgi:putative tail length tape measure protein|nr:MAG TPA: tail length tape measure protein [Caudoviricetes sp.]